MRSPGLALTLAHTAQEQWLHIPTRSSSAVGAPALALSTSLPSWPFSKQWLHSTTAGCRPCQAQLNCNMLSYLLDQLHGSQCQRSQPRRGQEDWTDLEPELEASARDAHSWLVEGGGAGGSGLANTADIRSAYAFSTACDSTCKHAWHTLLLTIAQSKIELPAECPVAAFRQLASKTSAAKCRFCVFSVQIRGPGRRS